MSFACSGVADTGIPSEKTRTSALSWNRSPGVVLPPTMSLFSSASTCQPSAVASFARWRLPFSPCSSPATAAKTMVAAGLSLDSTRAHSRLTATPEASSFAPGASARGSITSVLRES